MDVFELRDKIIRGDYARYTSSFVEINDKRIREEVESKFQAGLLWPEPLLQLNPAFASGGNIDELVKQNILHPLCSKIFRIGKSEENLSGMPMQLYKHQSEAISAAQKGVNYVLTTGTGSGKSLSYIIPIVDFILKNGSGEGIKAIIVYPMNALANSQELELKKFLETGHEHFPITFRRYTGQEKEIARQEILNNPPDILLTNYVMLELILTRPHEKKLIDASSALQFLVFDELHTYRGRQGADVGMLIRRLRATLPSLGTEAQFQCIGTSATLAAPGTFDEQKSEVAKVATKLFGSEILPENVIVETLKPETANQDFETAEFKKALAQVVADTSNLPNDYDGFIKNPLVVWIERTLGIEEKDNRFTRCRPRPLKGKNGLSETLSEITGIDKEQCEKRLKDALLAGYDVKKPNGKPVFAFKLHQFLSKGDTVYATIEPEDTRSITLFGQKFAPGREDQALLYPLHFCRECGKEYYSVYRLVDSETKSVQFLPCSPSDGTLEEGDKGYLFVNADNPWPDDASDQADRLPEDWFEEKNGNLVLSKSKKKYLPVPYFLLPDGSADTVPTAHAVPAWFLPAPFAFCPECLVSYNPRLGDFTKLATLGTEGRSTATTILSMSVVNHLREENELDKIAQKFLCFSDNRQDASLQSGHFNDFVEIGLIRSALYNALEQAGSAGIEFDKLPQKVFEALGLGYAGGEFSKERYSVTPEAGFGRAKNIDKAFKAVLEYRLYSDLRRGWRIVAPNLEQCGLLNFDYISLDELCAADDVWEKSSILYTTPPETRKKVCIALLDLMRRQLAIKAECLDPVRQDELGRQSRQQLIEPWLINDNEPMHHASIAFPRPKKAGEDAAGDVFFSPRGQFGKWLKRSAFSTTLPQDVVADVITGLFHALVQGGILEEVFRERQGEAGYQLAASAMIWKVGDGTEARHDPLRVRHKDKKARTNPFFVDMYRSIVKRGMELSAREHTAQVPGDIREQREELFRDATLPILYCSPTMELGVDISQLNAVGMRNVPPTPANYAQRSGRAGRSGQPALIITYCAQGNSHDQHFFRSPEQMVAGSVSTPRLDLANEDLIQAHIYALWLSASGLDLKKSLSELVDVSGTVPSLALLESVRAHLEDDAPKAIASARASKLLQSLGPDLTGCGWYSDSWLQTTMNNLEARFEGACERWRNLYRAAISQRDSQSQIANDASRPKRDRDLAEKLRSEAVTQINLLLEKGASIQTDFYSYRYFACEGFLPGYNFPRLPLSAFIPGSKAERGRDEYISRARFLAISEFGPGSIVYHEGSKYAITKVIMDVQADGSLAATRVKVCENCGYLEYDTTKDKCEMCNDKLPHAYNNLFRMRNVSTRRRDRINSDEEERMRFGYNLGTAYRFVEHGGMPSHRDATIINARDEVVAKLKYGHGATLWRINLGWLHRPKTEAPGFLLDRDKGTWVRQGKVGDADTELADPATVGNIERIIPYVEDRKNCLLFEPCRELTTSQVLSLQSALKQAIQKLYQLEDFELSTETMPTRGEPKNILFIESAEGGAGVLRRLVDDPAAMPRIAAEALDICHFDPQGNDLQKAPHAAEQCMVACYDCLMNYSNQRIHKELDRHGIRDLFLELAASRILPASNAKTVAEHLDELKKQCDSDLERDWLDFLYQRNLRLPSHAQYMVSACRTKPDFYYEGERIAIYIDGPYHDYPDRRKRDEEQQECMEDRGIIVLRFAAGDQWQIEIDKHPVLFGKK